jgi:hypothetical protein
LTHREKFAAGATSKGVSSLVEDNMFASAPAESVVHDSSVDGITVAPSSAHEMMYRNPLFHDLSRSSEV